MAACGSPTPSLDLRASGTRCVVPYWHRQNNCCNNYDITLQDVARSCITRHPQHSPGLQAADLATWRVFNTLIHSL